MTHPRRTARGEHPIFRWGARLLAPGFVIGLGVLLGACPEEPEPMDEPVDTTDGATSASPFLSCEPGEELSCTCATGQAGVQICQDDGASASGCTCPPLPDPDPGYTTVPPDPTNGDDDDASSGDATDSTAGTDSTGDERTDSSSGSTGSGSTGG